jgi:integrase/recombinase XerD
MPINRRKDTGKWGYRHYYRGRNYRRHAWETREEAVEAYQEFLDRLKKDLPIIDSNISFVEAVNKFLEYSARIGKSEWRLKALYANFKTFFLPFFREGSRLKDINHLEIESFIDNQLKRPIRKNTIHHYITDLNSLFNWAVREEILSANPVRKVNRKRIKPDKIIKEGFTPEEIMKCESVLEGPELLFFRFLKYTGARLSEALRTVWEDVDYRNLEIILRGTKTKESLRKVPMCRGLFETLKALEALKTDCAYLFHHKDGKRILRRDKVFKKVFRATGIKITAKDLRDYFASIMAMGCKEYTPDIVTVSELLGHTNLNTTKKYLYSLKERRMRAVSILDQVDGISTKISTEEGKKGGAGGLSAQNDWWRCRDLNPGHCGYEPHALTN